MAADSPSMQTLLEEAAAGKGRPIYLVEGDEYLARSSARELVDALVPEKDRALNLIIVDAAGGAREIAQHLNTVAMFAAPKAVVVEGAEALDEEVDAERELSRARDLWQGKRQRDATKRLLKLVRRAGWGPQDIAFGIKGAMTAAKWRKEVGAAPEDGDKAWLQELAAFAVAQKIAPPPEDVDALVKAVAKGLPRKTHLILVAEKLGDHHPLAKAIEEHGVRVSRKAERKGRGIETLDISGLVAHELNPLKKKLARDAETELKMRLGDDLRLIAVELQKLASYVGDRPTIAREDVEAIVAPVREEEFFALGEAVGEGNLTRALQLFHDELRRKTNASSVALPFLGGIASQVRKLLYDRARYEALNATDSRELAYNDFQARLFPAVERECKEKGQKVPNPFGSWLNYKRARRRTRAQWRCSLILCAEADFAVKNGADPQLLIERLLIDVCARA